MDYYYSADLQLVQHTLFSTHTERDVSFNEYQVKRCVTWPVSHLKGLGWVDNTDWTEKCHTEARWQKPPEQNKLN